MVLPSTALADGPVIGEKADPGEGTYTITYERKEGEIQPLYTSRKLWSANFELTNHYQIPKTIKLSTGYSGLTVYTMVTPNTADTGSYTVAVDEWYSWDGIWVSTKSWTTSELYSSTTFWGLSDKSEYRLHIYGNVKGSIDVYEAQP